MIALDALYTGLHWYALVCTGFYCLFSVHVSDVWSYSLVTPSESFWLDMTYAVFIPFVELVWRIAFRGNSPNWVDWLVIKGSVKFHGIFLSIVTHIDLFWWVWIDLGQFPLDNLIIPWSPIGDSRNARRYYFIWSLLLCIWCPLIEFFAFLAYCLLKIMASTTEHILMDHWAPSVLCSPPAS
jgi:hypothetical protein